MKISSINNGYIYNKSINFSSTRTFIDDANGLSVNCHYTNMNREDINWNKFAKFIDDRYKAQPKTPINLFGCSDGSEPYTLALAILNELPNDKASKFFPIKASDVSPDIIETAKKGKILLHQKDLDFLRETGNIDYFEPDNSQEIQIMRGINFYPYKVKPELQKCVEFSVKDIRTAAEKENFANGIVMFRNGWTFNSYEDQKLIANGLYKGSNKNSLIVIGQSDLFKSSANDLLQQSGFKGIKSDIYTEAETDYPSITIGQSSEKSNLPEFIFFEKA